MAAPLRITSPKNPRLVNAIKLRDSKHRRVQKSFLIDGRKSIELAQQSGIVLRELFVCEEFSDDTDALVETLHQNGGSVYLVSDALMGKLNYGEQSHDCVAIGDFFDTSLETLAGRIEHACRGKIVGKQKVAGLYLVIDRIEKPGNLGAILRTADAAGVDAVLLSDSICDVYNPNAIRSSLGGLFTLPIGTGTEEQVADWLKSNAIMVYTARVEGAVDYCSANYARKSALIIGNEAQGLGNRWNSNEYQAVRIPMAGCIDSLNASVSAAVVLFEMVRQKTASRKV
ncbi:TrmH family RNA methyltransferase [Pirellulaceae bacterium SH449]